MIAVDRFDDGAAEEWDEFCGGTVNGTLLHKRRFLSYHGDRFVDHSLILRNDGDIVAVLPAAAVESSPGVVVSHPGATYGGLVHDGWLTGQRVIDAMELVRGHFRESGFHTLRYKPIPHIYSTSPADDDLYALFRLGARRVRAELASCIDLDGRRTPTQRRRRALRKAQAKVTVDNSMDWLASFYEVLMVNLAARHAATPVHTLDELRTLIDRFPEEITLSVAVRERRVLAGVLFFRSTRVVHAQYIAATEEGFAVNSLDSVFECAISAAALEGLRFFDFGTCNEDEGRYLNEGLYRFKTEFGGGGVTYNQYEIDC